MDVSASPLGRLPFFSAAPPSIDVAAVSALCSRRKRTVMLLGPEDLRHRGHHLRYRESKLDVLNPEGREPCRVCQGLGPTQYAFNVYGKRSWAVGTRLRLVFEFVLQVSGRRSCFTCKPASQNGMLRAPR